MNLQDNIKKIRKDNNLSQEAFAEKLGVSRQSVSKWESGLAYPELDKVIQICNMFNVNMDDLINENIRVAKENEESQKNSNKLVSDFLSFITKSIDLIVSFSFKQKIKFFIEQIFIILFFIFIFVIFGSLFKNVCLNAAPQMHNFNIALLSILTPIYFLVSCIIIFIIWHHLFKVRYLDYYEIIHTSKESQEQKEDAVEQKEDAMEQKTDEKIHEKPKATEINKPKVIIRDEKSSNNSLFKFLSKIIIICVKVFMLFFAISIAFVIFSLAIVLVLSFLFKLNSLFFIGSIISLISSIIICLILFKMIYDFIFNRKNRKGILGIVIAICFLTCGMGLGIFTLDALNVDYIPYNEEDMVTNEFIVPMSDNLIIETNHYYDDKVEYIESDISDVKIECIHNKNIEVYSSTYETQYYNHNKYKIVSIYYDFNYEINFLKNIRDIIEDLNNYKIYNINQKIYKIYANKENIEKIKENTYAYRTDSYAYESAY